MHLDRLLENIVPELQFDSFDRNICGIDNYQSFKRGFIHFFQVSDWPQSRIIYTSGLTVLVCCKEAKRSRYL